MTENLLNLIKFENLAVGNYIRLFFLRPKINRYKQKSFINLKKKKIKVKFKPNLLFFNKSWLCFSIVGYIINLRKYSNKRLGLLLHSRRKKKVILSFFLLNSPNLFLILKLKQYKIRRKFLSYIAKKRKLKYQRIYPLRRVHRKKKKMK